YYLHRNPCARAGEDFLPTPAEDEGIAAFEAHDEPPSLGVMDQDRVDGRLLEVVTARRLACEDAEPSGRRLVEELVADELIVDDDIGGAQPPDPFQGDGPGVAGPGPHGDAASSSPRAAPGDGCAPRRCGRRQRAVSAHRRALPASA